MCAAVSVRKYFFTGSNEFSSPALTLTFLYTTSFCASRARDKRSSAAAYVFSARNSALNSISTVLFESERESLSVVYGNSNCHIPGNKETKFLYEPNRRKRGNHRLSYQRGCGVSLIYGALLFLLVGNCLSRGRFLFRAGHYVVK